MELLLSATACAMAILVGGGLYEFSVVDPAWPARPDIVTPDRGGISRKRFWIPAHCVFELLLAASLVMTWPLVPARHWLLAALAPYAVMRIWSAFEFIPKALAFERTAPEDLDPVAVRRWVRRSKWRFPLDLLTLFAVFSALITVAAKTAIEG